MLTQKQVSGGKRFQESVTRAQKQIEKWKQNEISVRLNIAKLEQALKEEIDLYEKWQQFKSNLSFVVLLIWKELDVQLEELELEKQLQVYEQYNNELMQYNKHMDIINAEIRKNEKEVAEIRRLRSEAEREIKKLIQENNEQQVILNPLETRLSNIELVS